MMIRVLIGLCMVTFSGALPQASLETTTTLPPLEPGCHYEKIEFQDIVEKEVTDKKCHDLNK